jgi:hypothetical protein
MDTNARLLVVSAAACLLPLLGCASEPHYLVHYVREITLTQAAPRYSKLGIRLLGVGPDGTTTIHVDETEETLAAKPGEYFLGAYSAPYNVRTFGEHGLYLRSADPSLQTAVLLRHSAGYR